MAGTGDSSSLLNSGQVVRSEMRVGGGGREDLQKSLECGLITVKERDQLTLGATICNAPGLLPA